jgi:hypothetical protein
MTQLPHPMMKPSAPRTLGTLSIVFGSIVAVFSGFGVLFGTTLGGMMQPSGIQREAFERYSADIHTVSFANNLAMFVMSLLLIYIGGGQRKYAPWARTASVKWGLAALGWLMVFGIVTCTVVFPAMERFVAEIAGQLHGVPMGGIMKFSMLFVLVLYGPYPIILITAFRRPHIVAAMSEPSLPTAIVHTGP